MNLTPNFTLQELVVSQTAARLGLDNSPTPWVVSELRRLAQSVLQPLRDAAGMPVVVSSGYRAVAVNAAVKGSNASDHMFGRAADITIPGMSVAQVCALIARMQLPYKQLIDELGAWTHVSIPPIDAAPKRQHLTARRSASGVMVYSPATF
jgi:hypothetical protein